ncbi:type IV secretory system conjugative DNA transfer family protein [Clostridium botulinum]|uniref:VirD4-like conjugal transfer protein, CD1115 family n=1 Tax=Clostridium botulinum TaxID=1491 RepID=UPI001C9A4FBF|nr:type IV secretory system conjugative DNA transfer family protein [Clostridium botulinum]MBY6889365.1 type IV secretory system conjugative DNA transfer family protein [Clostridium botulinum]
MKIVKEEKEQKIIIKKLSKINIINLIPKISKKNKYHSSGIVGEDLPKNKTDKVNKPILFLGLLIGFLMVFVGTYIFNLIHLILKAISESKSGLLGLNMNIKFQLKYLFPTTFTSQYLSICFMIIIGITFLFYGKLNHGSVDNIAYGQKGDSRFATIKEIKQQYIAIPEKAIPGKNELYEGIGGVPISYYKSNFYIDVDTVNTLVLGASRSGKGETFVFPLIDILSRAKVQSNMVVNDPKGELFSASKETLEKRGYRVLVLNIDNPLESMSYNPLKLVIDAWANEDYHEASKRANTLTSMLFSSGMGTDNEFFYSSAKSAINAIILTITEYCFKNNCREKITMYNVAQMLNELGSLFYMKNGKEVNALDEYFSSLPQGNQAKLEYGSTSFAGDKAKGSILSTASQGINMFTSDLFGKLTSKMSIDLKEIGFPKSFQFKLDNSMTGKRVNISFMRRKSQGKIEVYGNYRIKVKALGICVLNFDEKIRQNDYLKITYEDKGIVYRKSFQIKFPKKSENNEDHNYNTNLKLINLKTAKGFKELLVSLPILKYTEKPTAVFMVIPDYDPSNHVIGSIFISQLYTELATNCKETPKKQCFRRVHFILDEFGNMPAIDNMDGIMTVCLGRNILFNLIIQSYKQLEIKYDKGASIIKENCQNHIFIMSNDADTIEEVSNKCGHKTITSESANAKHMDTDSSVTTGADKERIITTDRLSQLIQGESVVLRNLHRQDKDRKKIRPFPIFNTKETNMPYRWQFLGEYFDNRKDINDIDIECSHVNLSLIENQIPFASFVKDFRTRLEYSIINNIPITEEDFEEFENLDSSKQQQFDVDKVYELSPQAVLKEETEDGQTHAQLEQLKNSVREFKESSMELKKSLSSIIKNQEDHINFFNDHLLGQEYYKYLNEIKISELDIEEIQKRLPEMKVCRQRIEQLLNISRIPPIVRQKALKVGKAMDKLVKMFD